MRRLRILKSKALWSLAVLSVISLSFLYIVQTNSEISERFLAKECVNRIAELSKENEVLQVSSAQAASLDKLAQLVEPLNFEKTENIHYIRVLSTQAIAK